MYRENCSCLVLMYILSKSKFLRVRVILRLHRDQLQKNATLEPPARNQMRNPANQVQQLTNEGRNKEHGNEFRIYMDGNADRNTLHFNWISIYISTKLVNMLLVTTFVA